MNIEHEGKTYEVLTIESIKLITHAKLAGGKVVEAMMVEDGEPFCRIASPSDLVLDDRDLFLEELADFGIQPLRLVLNEPVTFEAEAYGGHSSAFISLPAECVGKRFRCVEIVEEEAQAILKANGVEV